MRPSGRMRARAWLVVAIALSAVASARAGATTTVAVLPFHDLAGARSNVGEAIRETVTADLRQVAGLRVVERGQLDALLREQNLQLGADLDVPRAVQIGKLLGASHLATGAYQRAGGTIRLTARMVQVETGEIVGTAKVDGPAADFLGLQDRVTAELARSAGFARAPRPRPRLRNPRVLDTYGDALAARDDEHRRQLLRAAVNEEPAFDYAVHDLDALEQHLRDVTLRADAAREREGRARVDALKARVASGDSAARAAAWFALFDELHAQLRFRRLLDEARAVVEHPPLPKGDPRFARLDERARYELLLGLSLFKNDPDRLLKEGERFLVAYPSSDHYQDVKTFLEYALRWKRKAAEGSGNAEARLAALPPARRGDPCAVAVVYHQERQLKPAVAAYEKCVADPRAELNMLINLVNAYIAIPDFKSARRALALLKARAPGVAESPQHQGWRELPIDAD